ncbi:hypothetical protein EIP86_002393 [Pleurotus ostreatoroseus]|nr:hypothetical protein EIP86_002393 [Pleurotus ostreatoroseus]
MSDISSSKFGQPFDPELQGIIPQRFAHILENPKLFVQTVKSQLGADSGTCQTHGLLQDLLDFLTVTACSQHRKSSRAAKKTFIEEALVDALLETILAMQFVTLSQDEQAQTQIEVLATWEQERISTFLHDMWRRRIDIVRRGLILGQEMKNKLIDALLVCTLELEALDGRSLLTSTCEVGYLIVYLWVNLVSEWDSFGRFFAIVVNGLETPAFKDPWRSALESSLADASQPDAAQAGALFVKCARCLNVQEIPGAVGLTGVLQFVQCMIDLCPLICSADADLLWRGLFRNVSRACEREFCQSINEEAELSCNRTVIPLGIEIIQYVS